MNIRNKTIPGRLKPSRIIINAMADEAYELAKTIEHEPWRRLAMQAAVLVSQAKLKRTAAMHLESVHQYIEKNKKYGGKRKMSQMMRGSHDEG